MVGWDGPVPAHTPHTCTLCTASHRTTLHCHMPTTPAHCHALPATHRTTPPATAPLPAPYHTALTPPCPTIHCLHTFLYTLLPPTFLLRLTHASHCHHTTTCHHTLLPHMPLPSCHTTPASLPPCTRLPLHLHTTPAHHCLPFTGCCVDSSQQRAAPRQLTSAFRWMLSCGSSPTHTHTLPTLHAATVPPLPPPLPLTRWKYWRLPWALPELFIHGRSLHMRLPPSATSYTASSMPASPASPFLTLPLHLNNAGAFSV